jgi:ATP/maltotriose-dependent transcriptional regulator MalT
MTAEGMARIETMQYFRARPKYLEMQSIVMLAAGQADDAERSAIAALASAQQQGERGHEAWVLRQLGELACHRMPPDFDGAATHYRQAEALAREMGMRPLEARCHLALAELHVNTGKTDAARAELAAADTLFAAMAMTSWTTRVRGLLTPSAQAGAGSGTDRRRRAPRARPADNPARTSRQRRAPIP